MSIRNFREQTGKLKSVSRITVRNMLPVLIFLSLLTQYSCLCKDAIKIQSNQLHIKYGLCSGEYTVDISLLSNIKPVNCSQGNTSCLNWADRAYIKISKIDDNCSIHELMGHTSALFSLTNLSLYGGPEMNSQSWPMNKVKLDGGYVTKNDGGMAVLESYWLDSKGCYLYVNETVPLFVTQNETTLLLEAKNEPPYNRSGNITLAFRQCQFSNILAAHENAIKHVFKKPRKIPDLKMMGSPVWSTWTKFKRNISEDVIEKFADDILHHDFPRSQIEIDDKWESCYGDFQVDPTKFKNMTALVENLKHKGFRTTLWVHPFINRDCSSFNYANEKGYFVHNANNSVQTQWWNGNDSAYIDFTNDNAVNWWLGRLKKLKEETRVDSYKFDAGESSFSPQMPVFKKPTDHDPDTILEAYIKAINRSYDDMIEVRVGRRTQEYGLFVRMLDRNSRWTGNAGLSTLIPELLHLNIIGYSFVLPDMIGGNIYGDDILTEELFIRWLQANVFMPVLQFSYPPWDFSQETVNIARRFVTLHGSFASKIHDLMKHAVKTGEPVHRPLWWLDPTDPICLTTDSEFLLGNDLLVAPVLEKGARKRDIYLPKGFWKDELKRSPQIIEGPLMLKDYPVRLDQLPYFSQVYPHINAGHAPFTSVLLISILVTVFLFFTD